MSLLATACVCLGVLSAGVARAEVPSGGLADVEDSLGGLPMPEDALSCALQTGQGNVRSLVPFLTQRLEPNTSTLRHSTSHLARNTKIAHAVEST